MAQPGSAALHRLSAWTESRWALVVFGLLAALLTWEPVQLVPAPGPDPSWVLSLHLSAIEGLDHGTEFVWTYGPLGFLGEPLVIDGVTATLSALYVLATRALLAAALFWAGRRSFGWPAAALLALAAVAITPRAVVPLALVVVFTLAALEPHAPRWRRSLLLYGGPAFAALELLVKINVGLTICALIAVAVVFAEGPRLRNAATALVSFLVSLIVLWFLAGQGLGNLDDFARYSLEIVSGYSEALQTSAAAVGWDLWAAALAAIATLAATAIATRDAATGPRLGALAIVVLLLLSLEKQAFVRHDPTHVAAFFGCLPAVWLTLRWRGTQRWAAAGAVVLIAAAFFAATERAVKSAIQPKLAVEQLRGLLLPGERDELRDDARASLQAAYALDPAIIERLGDAPVDVRPWETALVWAYDLNWKPLPIVQDYQTYTPELDELNAAALESEAGPEYVLRHLGYENVFDVDGRLASFEVPLETRALLCRFRPAASSPAHQLLVRDEDRCGEPRPLGTVEAEYGEVVEVPAARPGEAVFAAIDGAGAAGIETLRSLLAKPAIRRIGFGGASVRFVPANAESGLLLRAPADADFPVPFALAPNPELLEVSSEGGFASSDGPLTIEFTAVPIAPLGD